MYFKILVLFFEKAGSRKILFFFLFLISRITRIWTEKKFDFSSWTTASWHHKISQENEIITTEFKTKVLTWEFCIQPSFHLYVMNINEMNIYLSTRGLKNISSINKSLEIACNRTPRNKEINNYLYFEKGYLWNNFFACLPSFKA